VSCEASLVRAWEIGGAMRAGSECPMNGKRMCLSVQRLIVRSRARRGLLKVAETLLKANNASRLRRCNLLYVRRSGSGIYALLHCARLGGWSPHRRGGWSDRAGAGADTTARLCIPTSVPTTAYMSLLHGLDIATRPKEKTMTQTSRIQTACAAMLDLTPIRTLCRWYYEKTTFNALSSLSDAQLKDIGVYRGSIPSIARHHNGGTMQWP
jgi:uncharacterized protein YjiS (DUF1127 family)